MPEHSTAPTIYPHICNLYWPSQELPSFHAPLVEIFNLVETSEQQARKFFKHDLLKLALGLREPLDIKSNVLRAMNMLKKYIVEHPQQITRILQKYGHLLAPEQQAELLKYCYAPGQQLKRYKNVYWGLLGVEKQYVYAGLTEPKLFALLNSHPELCKFYYKDKFYWPKLSVNTKSFADFRVHCAQYSVSIFKQIFEGKNWWERVTGRTLSKKLTAEKLCELSHYRPALMSAIVKKNTNYLHSMLELASVPGSQETALAAINQLLLHKPELADDIIKWFFGKYNQKLRALPRQYFNDATLKLVYTAFQYVLRNLKHKNLVRELASLELEQGFYISLKKLADSIDGPHKVEQLLYVLYRHLDIAQASNASSAVTIPVENLGRREQKLADELLKLADSNSLMRDALLSFDNNAGKMVLAASEQSMQSFAQHKQNIPLLQEVYEASGDEEQAVFAATHSQVLASLDAAGASPPRVIVASESPKPIRRSSSAPEFAHSAAVSPTQPPAGEEEQEFLTNRYSDYVDDKGARWRVPGVFSRLAHLTLFISPKAAKKAVQDKIRADACAQAGVDEKTHVALQNALANRTSDRIDPADLPKRSESASAPLSERRQVSFSLSDVESD